MLTEVAHLHLCNGRRMPLIVSGTSKKFRAKVARDNHAALGPTPRGLNHTIAAIILITNTAMLA